MEVLDQRELIGAWPINPNLNKIPVVVRMFRDTKNLIALFVTTPYNEDVTKCWAYEAGNGLTYAVPTRVYKQSVPVDRSLADKFVELFDRRMYRVEIGEQADARFEVHQRDRIVQNMVLRKEKWNARNTSQTTTA